MRCRNYEIRFYDKTCGRRGSEAWSNAQDSRSDAHGTISSRDMHARMHNGEMSNPVP